MTKGAPLPSQSVPPRSTILGVLPGLPELCVTFRPATAPDNAWAGFEKTPTFNASSFTLVIELVTFERSCLPP